MKEISPYTFHGLDNLTKLDLSDNYLLVSLHITSFTGLQSLEILDLRYCDIDSLSLHANKLKSFIFLPAKHWYTFYGPFVPGNTFRYTQGIENLTISYSISSYYLESDDGLLLFNGLRQLKFLTLDNNDFSSGLPNGLFDACTILQELDIHSSLISYIQSSLFAHLTNLQLLNLKGNYIKHLPPLFHLYHLMYLYLNDNKLIDLHKDAFRKMSSLKELKLEGNFLTSFNHSTFSDLGAMTLQISLSGNPLACNCELGWFTEWMKGPVQIIDKDDIICSATPATLSSLRGKRITLFEPAKLCSTNPVLFSAVPFAFLGLTALAMFTYYFRWYLKHKIFLLKLAVLGYDELQDARDHKDFEYDLNVVLFDENDDWVEENLRPVLLQRLQDFGRNAIGDDNLPLGMYYLDAIYHVMERSYKIVLLISRAAVQNNIFLTKFRMAQDLVNDLQIENVIVIFLEEIPDEELPFVVRLYLSSRRPYLRWTEDDEGREYFWLQFIKLLKVNKKHDPLIPAD